MIVGSVMLCFCWCFVMSVPYAVNCVFLFDIYEYRGCERNLISGMFGSCLIF